jgi:ABC-type Na+ transport system ATPase subunit NatA
LCDRLAILHRGHVLAEGTLPELRDRYQENDLEELFFTLISDHDGGRSNSEFRIQNSECAAFR